VRSVYDAIAIHVVRADATTLRSAGDHHRDEAGDVLPVRDAVAGAIRVTATAGDGQCGRVAENDDAAAGSLEVVRALIGGTDVGDGDRVQRGEVDEGSCAGGTVTDPPAVVDPCAE